MSTHQSPPEESVSATALGGIIFAASILLLAGLFQLIAGLAAILQDEFYVVSPNYVFAFDTTTWGWIHLLVGLLVAATGAALFARQAWAIAFAIGIAGLSALANFFFIPYYPMWAIVVIALDVWVIWALTRPGATRV